MDDDKSQTDPKLWTVIEAADVMKVSEQWVRKLLMNRRIASVKVGSSRLIPSRVFLSHYRELLIDPETRENAIAYLNEKATQYGKTPFCFDPEREIVR